MVCSDINSAIGSGADFYQIQASENQFSSTGFTCEDQVNSNYIDIEEDEYDTCIADVLDMQARYAPAGDLCEVMAPTASACPSGRVECRMILSTSPLKVVRLTVSI